MLCPFRCDSKLRVTSPLHPTRSERSVTEIAATGLLGCFSLPQPLQGVFHSADLPKAQTRATAKVRSLYSGNSVLQASFAFSALVYTCIQ